MFVVDNIAMKRATAVIEDYKMAIILPRREVFEDIYQAINFNLQSHLFMHFPL